VSLDIEQFRKRFYLASTFSRRAFAGLESLHTQDFHGKRERNVKKLIEEVVPIAIFARNFEAPERRVKCKYTSVSISPSDGEMRLSGASVEGGFVESFYYLEVTTAEAPYEYLKREALAKNGFVFSGPKIRRIGSRQKSDSVIKSEPSVTDGDSGVTDTVRMVQAAIEKKLEIAYPSPCILLVRVEPEGILGFREWCAVAENGAVAGAYEKFAGIYIIYTSSALSMPVSGR
jgi:hypothetical protein